MYKKSESFTTYQLQILAYLLRVRSVTQTAEHFNTSQPSVSRLLADMRIKFADKLLVRGSKEMLVTDRARLLCNEIDDILQRVDNMSRTEQVFEPRTSERLFSVGFTDSNISSLGPAVISAIEKEAKHIRTRLQPVSPAQDIIALLENRELDVVLDCVTEHNRHIYGDLKYYPLAPQDIVLLTCKGHPITHTPPVTLEDYLSLKHVGPSSYTDVETDPIDSTLLNASRPRRIHTAVPDYNLIPFILMDSEMVFTTSREFAERFAALLPLEITPAPSFFPKLEFRMLWHEVTDQSKDCIWLRKTIQSAANLRN